MIKSKKKIKSKILSCVLAGVLLLSSMPMTNLWVSAEGLGSNESAQSTLEDSSVQGGYLNKQVDLAQPNAMTLATEFSGGDGSESTPYLISSLDDLKELATNVNAGTNYAGKYFKQTKNITVDETYTPIGYFTAYNKWSSFAGIYDGGNCTIDGTINKPEIGFVAAFGYVRGTDAENPAEIKNLNTNITVTGLENVAGIAGMATYAKFADCTNSGNINGVSTSVFECYIGGIVGSASSTTIENCSNSGAIISTIAYVGGIVGDAGNCKIANCTNSGAVTSNSNGQNGFIGGIVGDAGYGTTIEICINTADITSNYSWYTGGVVGRLGKEITLKNSYNAGTVTGKVDTGGVVGKVAEKAVVSNCYNTAKVISTASSTGGVVGENEGTIEYCYNIGDLSESDSAGSIYGSYTYSSVITNCYYNKEICNASKSNGTGLTSEQMTGDDALTNMAGFDGEIWKVNDDFIEGSTTTSYYPVLRSNEQNPAPSFSSTKTFEDILEGKGTVSEPYLIPTLEKLNEFANYVNSGIDTTGLYFKQTGDITITGDYAPVGNSYNNAFKGNYDAGVYENGEHTGNHTITANINMSDSYNVGVFGYINTATIKNLNVKGTVKGKSNVGSLVGYSTGNSIILNCTNEATVSGNGSVGGILGNGSGTIENCTNLAEISCANDANGQIGGIVGYATGTSYDVTLKNCTNKGDITGSSFIGGIVGCGNTSTATMTISKCYNTGKLEAEEAEYVGGIFGGPEYEYNIPQGVYIEYCYNHGDVSGYDNIAGIAGNIYSYNNLTDCYNAGAVISTGSKVHPIAIAYKTDKPSEYVAYYNKEIFTDEIDYSDVCKGLTTLEMTGSTETDRAQDNMTGFGTDVWVFTADEIETTDNSTTVKNIYPVLIDNKQDPLPCFENVTNYYNVVIDLSSSVTLGSGCVISQKIEVEKNLSDIVIIANSGYGFTNDYISNLNTELENVGLTATRNGTKQEITISGTPTDNFTKTVTATKQVNAVDPVITNELKDKIYDYSETVTPLNATATVSDGGTITYQWYIYGDYVWNEISKETNATFTPSSTKVGESSYKVIATNTIEDNGDGGVKTATTESSIDVTVNADVPVFDPDLSETTVSYNYGSDATALTVNASVKDGGTLTYQWECSSDNSNFNDIEGATGKSYTPSTDTVGTVYYRCVVKNVVGDMGVYEKSKVATITVVRINPTISITDVGTLVYGDADFDLVVNGVKENSDLSYNVTGSAVEVDENGKVTIKSAGEVTIKVTSSETANYNSATANITFTVDKKDLTVTADALDKFYGEDDDTLTYTYSGNVSGETPSFTGTLVREEGEAIDSYKVSVGDLAIANNGEFIASNYNLVFDTTIVNYTIKEYTTENDATPLLNANSNGWYNASEIMLTPPAYYTICTTNGVDDEFKTSLVISTEQKENATVTYYLRSSTGAISTAKTFTYNNDVTVPSGKIEFKENKFTSILNTLTFNLFFKETVDVNITGTDELSGVAKIEYQKLAKNENFNLNGTWTESDKLSVNANDQFSVYAKITDKAGNYSIINSDGVVVYTDSTAVTESFNFIKSNEDNVTVTVNTNGNTVKDIKLNGKVVSSTNYLVSEEINNVTTITFTNAYLKSLTRGENEFVISYNPLGLDYADATSNSEEPNTTSVTANIIEVIKDTTTKTQTTTYTSESQTASIPTAETVGEDLVIKYQDENGDYTLTEIPSFENAGTYTINYELSAQKHETVTGSIEYTIDQVELSWTQGTAAEKTYDGLTSAEVVTAPSISGTVGGDVAPEITVGEINFASKNVGTHAVTATGYLVANDPNYIIPQDQPTFDDASITAKDLTVTPDTLDKFYGEDDDTLTYTYSGNVTGETPSFTGTLVREEGETIGSYEVSVGDLAIADNGEFITSNYEFVFVDTVVYTINEYTTDAFVAEKPDWFNAETVTLTAPEGYTISLTNGVKDTFSTELTVDTTEGSEQEVVYFLRNESKAISTAKTFIYNNEKVAPTGTVTIDETTWDKFLSVITFGIYKAQDVEVSITSADELSGLKSTEYYVADTSKTLEDLEAITDWTEYSAYTIPAEDAKEIIVYAKITDNAGNITYLSSDGVLFDTTDPVIEGVESFKFYKTDLIINVTDDNLDTVTLNDKEVKSEILIKAGTEGNYTLVATDKAGNSTTIYFTTYADKAPVDEVLDDLLPVDDIFDKVIINNLTEEVVTNTDKETAKDDQEQVDTLNKLDEAFQEANGNITVVPVKPVIDENVSEDKKVTVTDIIPQGLAVAVYGTQKTEDDIKLSLSVKQQFSELEENIDKLIFDVKPLVSVNGAEATIIPNDDIKSPVTFKLYLNDSFKGTMCNVEHIKENGEIDVYSNVNVNEDEIGKFIELSVSEFSNFIVSEIEYKVSIDGVITEYKPTEKVTLEVPTKDGCVFKGFETSDVTITDNEFIMPEKDVTITTIWKSNVPDTGDNSNSLLNILIMLISLTTILGIVLNKRKFQTNK